MAAAQDTSTSDCSKNLENVACSRITCFGTRNSTTTVQYHGRYAYIFFVCSTTLWFI